MIKPVRPAITTQIYRVQTATTTASPVMFPAVDAPHASSLAGRAGSAKSSSSSDIETSVWTSTEIPADVRFGPFDGGEFRLGITMKDRRDSPYMLEVKYSDGRLVSGPDSHPTRWMRFVAAAHDEHEQNLSAVRSSDGLVMFRTTRCVLRGEELLVWYANSYAEYQGIPTAINRYRGKDGYSCPRCPKTFRYPNTLKSHIRFRCPADHGESSTLKCRSRTGLGSAFHRIATVSSGGGPVTSSPSSSSSSSSVTGDTNGHHRQPAPHGAQIDATVNRGTTAMMDIYSLAKCALSATSATGSRKGQSVSLISDGTGSAFRPHPSRPRPLEVTNSQHRHEKEGFRVVRTNKEPVASSGASSASSSSATNSRLSSQNDRKVAPSFTVEKIFGLARPSSPQRALPNTIIGEPLLPTQRGQQPKTVDRNCLPAGYHPCPVSAHHHADTPVAISGSFHRPLDPYASFPYRFYHHHHHHGQPSLHPGLSRYGAVLPALHTNGELYGSSVPCFSYKLPFHAGLLRYPDSTAPLVASASGDVVDLNKYSNLERSLANQGVTSFHDPQLFTNHHAASSTQAKRGHLCIYCGKLYSRKYGLKIHLRTHTGYKPLKCKVCLRPFGDPSNLNKHIRLHAEGDTPYRCQYCGKVLVRRRDLDRHIRSRHPGEGDKRDGCQQEGAPAVSDELIVVTSSPPSVVKEMDDDKRRVYGTVGDNVTVSSPDCLDEDEDEDENEEEMENGIHSELTERINILS